MQYNLFGSLIYSRDVLTGSAPRSTRRRRWKSFDANGFVRISATMSAVLRCSSPHGYRCEAEHLQCQEKRLFLTITLITKILGIPSKVDPVFLVAANILLFEILKDCIMILLIVSYLCEALWISRISWISSESPLGIFQTDVQSIYPRRIQTYPRLI